MAAAGGKGMGGEVDGGGGGEDGCLVRVSEMFSKGTMERRFDDLWLRRADVKVEGSGTGMGRAGKGKGGGGTGTGEGSKRKCTLRLVPLPRDRNNDMRNQEDFVVAMASRPGMIEHFLKEYVPGTMDEIQYMRGLSRVYWRRGDWAVQQVHFDRRNVGALWIHQDDESTFHVVADLCELFTESGCPSSLMDAVLVGLTARLNLKAGVQKVKLCGRSVTSGLAERVESSLKNMKFSVDRKTEKCEHTSKNAFVFVVDSPVGAKDKDCEEEMSRILLNKPVVNLTPTLSIVEDVSRPLFTVVGWQQSKNYQALIGSEVDSVEKDMNVYFFIRLETPFSTSKTFDFRMQVLSADGEPVNCSYRFKEPYCYRQRIVLYADEWLRDESVGFIPYQKGPLNVVLEMREAFIPDGIIARRIVRIREVVKAKKRARTNDGKDFRRKRFGLDAKVDKPEREPRPTDGTGRYRATDSGDSFSTRRMSSRSDDAVEGGSLEVSDWKPTNPEGDEESRAKPNEPSNDNLKTLKSMESEINTPPRGPTVSPLVHMREPGNTNNDSGGHPTTF